MPFLLRKIRRSRWNNSECEWIKEDDIHSDPLADLSTNNGELSVFYIDDDKTNLDHIIAALAAGCDRVSNIDYVIFDSSLLSEVKIKIKETVGGTPDQEVNNKWHRDLCELSGFRLIKLVKTILETGELNRIMDRETKGLIRDSILIGRIDRTKLKPDLLKDIDRTISA